MRGAFCVSCPTLTVTFLQTTDLTLKGPFYRTSLDLPTLLESNLGCFQRVPPLVTIVFEAFVVTRQTTQKVLLVFLAL